MSVVERQDQLAVAVLTLNRPKRRNALSGDLIEALHAALEEIALDETIRAIVLTGAGKVFCAGGDLGGSLQAGGTGVVAAHQSRARYGEVLAAMPKHRVPIIAALNGDALGGGLGLAAACDLVVADADARLGTPEIRLGLFPWVITAVLQRNVGRKALMELVLTGGKVSAEEAKDLGLVNRVAASGQALTDALALATEIAGRAPLAISMGKAAFYSVADLNYEDALRYLNTQLTLNLLTEDAFEGVGAFLQKRQPVWKGR